MTIAKIKNELENTSLLRDSVDHAKHGSDWSKYTRTAFTHIAKAINQKVTQDVINSPVLIIDNLLMGANEMDRIFRKESITTVEDFISTLKSIPKYRTYNWISGKTLQAYWTGESTPKEKKINVLLTFLGVNFEEWEDWKRSSEIANHEAAVDSTQALINEYYAGNYYRFYQKANKDQCVICAPFRLYQNKKGQMIAESKTVGHTYQSTSIDLRDGALYIQMKNLKWDEYEFHIINVGFAVMPSILMGTSSSLNNKKQAIAKRNILVKTDHTFDFTTETVIEYPYDKQLDGQSIEHKIQQYFKREGNNLIVSEVVHSLDDLM